MYTQMMFLSSIAFISLFASSIKPSHAYTGGGQGQFQSNNKKNANVNIQVDTNVNVNINADVHVDVDVTHNSQSSSVKPFLPKTSRKLSSLSYPQRPLTPPFPNGLCNGRLVTLPPSEHYLLDSNLSGNTLLLPQRDIQVWLPPQYDQHPTMKFPVLYCHDGQNAMQDSTSWTGYSWRLAGALTRLSERQLLTKDKTNTINAPPIVVLIPCNEERIAGVVPRRHLEYGDISNIVAVAHSDFVALTLKPLIDSKFRTKRSVEYTSTIGSSLGGQASMHLLLRHGDIFGGAACLSPAFQPSILAAAAVATNESLKGKRIYIDNGGDEEDVKVPFVDLVDFMSKDHWWNPGKD